MHHKGFAEKWLDMQPHMEGQSGNKKLGLYKVCSEPYTLGLMRKPLNTVTLKAAYGGDTGEQNESSSLTVCIPS